MAHFADRLRPVRAMSIAFGVASISFFIATAPAQADTGARAPDTIYARTCGYCHGHNVGPVLLGRKLPAETIIFMVRHGQGAMPAFRPTEITDAELANLATWISASPTDTKEHGK